MLATEAESEWPDLTAMWRAHAQVGFYLQVLERLDGSVPGAFLVGEAG